MLWRAAAEKASDQFLLIGEEAEGGITDRQRLRAALAERASASQEPLWVVLIGHGTFDGREAKFNLRGPDVTDAELLDWLKPIQRPVAILNCFSASGPFLSRLSAPNRVVVTATRSGDEQNFARFGQYLAESVADPSADLDKDGQVSLLEAYLVASNRTAEFYRTRSRLATEHPLLDDNGDRLGTPADWFRGLHATKRAKDGAEPDGVRAHQLHIILSDREQRMSPDQRQRRDKLERSAAALTVEEGPDPRGRILRPARNHHDRAGPALSPGSFALIGHCSYPENPDPVRRVEVALLKLDPNLRADRWDAEYAHLRTADGQCGQGSTGGSEAGNVGHNDLNAAALFGIDVVAHGASVLAEVLSWLAHAGTLETVEVRPLRVSVKRCNSPVRGWLTAPDRVPRHSCTYDPIPASFRLVCCCPVRPV